MEITREQIQKKIDPRFFGTRVKLGDDEYFVGDFSEKELGHIYYGLTASKNDEYLIFESPTLDEVDEFYNPGDECVSDDFILEAITISKFAKADSRMAALVRVLNKHLKGNEHGIEALPAIIGKPKKSGMFAYVTTQVPFSDGQSVSMVFHSPEGDKKKIGPSDEVIAFRWLLNKRDITQVVAPENGADVSLVTLGKRVTQLVVKNHVSFVKKQKDAVEEEKKLKELEAQMSELEQQNTEKSTVLTDVEEEKEAVEAKIKNTEKNIEKQQKTNADLEAEIAALQARVNAKSVGGNGSNAEPTSDGSADTDSVGGSRLKLDDVLVEWKPRFRDSVPPEIPTLSAKMGDKVFMFGDIDMLSLKANVTIEGKPDSGAEYAKIMLSQIKNAQADGYSPNRVKYKGSTQGILVKDDYVLTKAEAEKYIKMADEPTDADSVAMQETHSLSNIDRIKDDGVDYKDGAKEAVQALKNLYTNLQMITSSDEAMSYSQQEEYALNMLKSFDEDASKQLKEQLPAELPYLLKYLNSGEARLDEGQKKEAVDSLSTAKKAIETALKSLEIKDIWIDQEKALHSSIASYFKSSMSDMPQSLKKPIRAIKLFGSFTRDSDKANDIDVFIKIDENSYENPQDFTEIADAIEAWFNKNAFKKAFGKEPDFLIDSNELAMGAERGKGVLLYTQATDGELEAKRTASIEYGSDGRITVTFNDTDGQTFEKTYDDRARAEADRIQWEKGTQLDFPSIFAEESQIDKAATEGYEDAKQSGEMPTAVPEWVADDDELVSAYRVGARRYFDEQESAGESGGDVTIDQSLTKEDLKAPDVNTDLENMTRDEFVAIREQVQTWDDATEKALFDFVSQGNDKYMRSNLNIKDTDSLEEIQLDVQEYAKEEADWLEKDATNPTDADWPKGVERTRVREEAKQTVAFNNYFKELLDFYEAEKSKVLDFMFNDEDMKAQGEFETYPHLAPETTDNSPEADGESGVPEMEKMVEEAARWKGATMKVAKLVEGDKKTALKLSKMTTKGDLDAYLMKKFGIDETTARDVSNELTDKNIPADMKAKIDDFASEPWSDLASSKNLDSDSEIQSLGVADITSVGSENVYVEKEDGTRYFFKPGDTSRFEVGSYDFSNEIIFNDGTGATDTEDFKPYDKISDEKIRKLLDEAKQLFNNAKDAGLNPINSVQFMKDVNTGNRGGFSVADFEKQLKEDEKSLKDLESGKIRANKIIGTGGRKPQAIKWLQEQIEKTKTALENDGFVNFMNIRNYISYLNKLINGEDTGFTSDDELQKEEQARAEREEQRRLEEEAIENQYPSASNYEIGDKTSMREPFEVKFNINSKALAVDLTKFQTPEEKYQYLTSKEGSGVKQQELQFNKKVDLNGARLKNVPFTHFKIEPRKGYALATLTIDLKGSATDTGSGGEIPQTTNTSGEKNLVFWNEKDIRSWIDGNADAQKSDLNSLMQIVTNNGDTYLWINSAEYQNSSVDGPAIPFIYEKEIATDTASEGDTKPEQEYLDILDAIISGDYDENQPELERQLDLVADKLEEMGLMDEHEELLNKAADKAAEIAVKNAIMTLTNKVVEGKNSPTLDKLMAGTYNNLPPIKFLAMLEKAAKELDGDVEPIKEPTIKYLANYQGDMEPIMESALEKAIESPEAFFGMGTMPQPSGDAIRVKPLGGRGQQAPHEITIDIDHDFNEPQTFRGIIQALENASPNDQVTLKINSPGGRTDSAQAIYVALLETEAKTKAKIINAASSGSIVAMACDEIETTPFCTMMIHNASGGARGKVSDMAAASAHHKSFFQEWYDQLYAGFLTAEEISDVVKGQEFWLKEKDIIERLKNWKPIRERLNSDNTVAEV